jgi:hypothetical protein
MFQVIRSSTCISPNNLSQPQEKKKKEKEKEKGRNKKNSWGN